MLMNKPIWSFVVLRFNSIQFMLCSPISQIKNWLKKALQSVHIPDLCPHIGSEKNSQKIEKTSSLNVLKAPTELTVLTAAKVLKAAFTWLGNEEGGCYVSAMVAVVLAILCNKCRTTAVS